MELNQDQEHELVQRARRGDRDATNLLLRRSSPMLVRMVGAHIRDEDDVLDILQAVLLSIWKSIRSLESPGAYRAWAFRIVRSRVMDHLRRRYAADLVAPVQLERDMDQFPSSDEGARTLAELYGHLSRHVEEVIARQGEAYRTVLRLHLRQGKTCEEIAKETGKKVGTVKSLVSRGKIRLLTELEKLG